jgi:hypothetical protein
MRMSVSRLILIAAIIFVGNPSYAAETAQFVCIVRGVYTNEGGKLVQRSNDTALGKQLYVNADTGEVTGYYGTDGFDVRKVRRPNPNELLTVETSSGLDGDAADRLRIEQRDEITGRHNFVYNKGWLVISGDCEAVRRHK